jgi:Spy/CpxP family protein refolding chaperone
MIMNTLLKRVLPGTVLSGVLLLSASAWSMGHHPGHNPERMLTHMTERLDLSASQQTQIETLLRESREAAESDHRRTGEIRDELKAMRLSFDAGKAQRLADELGEVSSRMAYLMARTQADVYQLLTPAQREEMDELSAIREKRMQQRRPGR